MVLYSSLFVILVLSLKKGYLKYQIGNVFAFVIYLHRSDCLVDVNYNHRNLSSSRSGSHDHGWNYLGCSSLYDGRL